MKQNREIFRQGVDATEKLIESIKLKLINNLDIDDNVVVDGLYALDEFYIEIRKRLRDNYKNVTTMNLIIEDTEYFLNQELLLKLN